MLEIILICAIGLIPPLLSFVLLRKMQMRAQARLRNAVQAAERRQIQRLLSLPAEYHYVEGVGALIGDSTCRYNARSTQIRCAVNPSGPCKECPYYESIASPTNPS